MAFVAPWVYYAIAAVGAGVSAYGVIQQGKAQQRESNFNAQVQENNAVSAGYAAIQEDQAGEREAEALRETRLRALASNRTAAAHAGLTLSGSVLDSMSDSAIQSEREIQMAKHRGKLGAYDALNQAANYRTQATLTRMSGANAKSSSRYQAAGTLLSGASSAGTGYAAFKKG